MEQNFEKSAEQAAAFQRIWTETATRMYQAAFNTTPNSPPPEVLRQIRNGIFQALAQSWDEFMRSPQFLESMRQWMENAVSFRKLTNDFLARVRNEVQAPSRDDIDTVMLNIRHMEKRLLDKMEELSQAVNAYTKNPVAARPASQSKTAGSRKTAGGTSKRPKRKAAA